MSSQRQIRVRSRHYTTTSASASTRTIDSSSRSPPTAAAAEPFSLSELPALMSYAEEVLDNFDLKKQALAAGEIDDDELIDEFERQILSMTRRLRRAKKLLGGEADEYESKCAALTIKNRMLHQALVHAREKVLALREVNDNKGACAECEDLPAPTPPTPPPRRRRSRKKHS
ncbi:hypothetical protein MRX96_049899 [Rhipicephalus microplus]